MYSTEYIATEYFWIIFARDNPWTSFCYQNADTSMANLMGQWHLWFFLQRLCILHTIKRFKNRFEDDPVLWLLREFDQSSVVVIDHTESEGQLGNDPAGGGGADRRAGSYIKVEVLGEFEVVFETAKVCWTGEILMKKKKRNILGHSPCKYCVLCITWREYESTKY